MLKVLLIARREFISTALSKGFLLGILMMPLMALISIGGSILAMREGGPRLEGTIAVIDSTPGQVVAPRIAERFSPEFLAKEAAREQEEISQITRDASRNVPTPQTQKALTTELVAQAGAELARKSAGLSVETLPPGSKPEDATSSLAAVDVHSRSRDPNSPIPRVMVVVVPEACLAGTRSDSTGLPHYEDFKVYTAPHLDFEISDRVERRVAEAIIDARIVSDPRLSKAGMSPDAVRAMTKRPEARVINVTRAGEKESAGALQKLIPMAFLFLLFMSVLISGQYLLTSTIEEKSSRVMEVLLSAVSPMQLMVGKIVGQMGVGLVMIGLYSSVGMVGLVYASLQDAIEPWKLACLAVYFLIAYFSIASLMAAIGSAVSDMREAQALVTPVMMLMIIPWVLSMAIGKAPNSTFAQVLSFIPGCNAFVMVTRLFGAEPVPTWQIPVSMAIGAAGAVFFAWAAAKIFRIGVLMYGKPPNLKTLIRWVRMA